MDLGKLRALKFFKVLTGSHDSLVFFLDKMATRFRGGAFRGAAVGVGRTVSAGETYFLWASVSIRTATAGCQ